MLVLTGAVALLVDPLTVLQAAYLPGAAIALLALTGKGAGKRATVATAACGLRVGIAVSLIAAAFAEKLAAPAVTEAVLQTHPELNVLDLVGLDASPATFVLAAGCVEALIAGLLLWGAATEIGAPLRLLERIRRVGVLS